MKIMNVKSVARHLVKNAIACTMMIALVFTMAPAESFAASKVPAQPKITKAAVVNSNAVQLKWNKANNAAKYKVYRKKADGKFVLVKTTTKKTFKNTKLAYGTKYTYKVTAITKAGKKNTSKVKTVYTKPAKPVITAKVYDSNNVKVTWKSTKGAAKYKVYRKKADGKFVLVKTTTERTYESMKLAYGTKYTYKVAAVSKAGKTNTSVVKTVTTGKKSSVKVTKLDDVSLNIKQTANHTVKLEWNMVKNAEGYILYRSVGDDLDFQPLTKTKETAFTNTAVKKGTTYYYKVEAYNGNVRSFSKGMGVTVDHDWKPVYGEKDNGYYKPAYTCTLCNGLDVSDNIEAHTDQHRAWTVTEGQKPQKGYYEDQYVKVYSAVCNQCDAVIADDTANMSNEEYNGLVSLHMDNPTCGGWRTTSRWEIKKVWVPDENGSETKMVAYDKYTCDHCGKEITDNYKTHQCFINETPTNVWVSKIETVVTGYKCSICGTTK